MHVWTDAALAVLSLFGPDLGLLKITGTADPACATVLLLELGMSLRSADTKSCEQ